MRSTHVAGFIVIGVMAFTVSAWSHHAHGNYAVTTVDIEGVVTELHLLNPHSWWTSKSPRRMARSSCGRSRPPPASR